MRRTLVASALALTISALVAAGQRATKSVYYPPPGDDWQRKPPAELAFNPELLEQAVAFAKTQESKVPRDFSTQVQTFGALLGPIPKERGETNGMILRNGYIVAEWGDPKRADITNSVTKTFLTTVVGLAVQRGLIKDVSDYARDYMPPHVDLFDAPHNQKIKWDDLLRQTSDWQGTLWGKPDWADRPVGETPDDWAKRKLYEPGTHFKYNDVRVNVMALAALQVWRRSLPDVLREEVMEPIGASSTWRWYGYENS